MNQKESIRKTRTGVFKKANFSTRTGNSEYYYFVPDSLPHQIKYDEDLVYRVSQAMRCIMELEKKVQSIASARPIITLYLAREAALSSQIEGTYASMQDAYELEAGIENAERPKDAKLIVNYKKAFKVGLSQLEKIGLTTRLIKESHKILWEDVGGELQPDPTPGEFRTWQNRIGGTDLATATYVPPPINEMQEALSNLEKFMNTKDQIDPLIKAAFIHAQFETIHPFGDGNGRIGRILILFYLLDQKVLSAPVLYISYFFKRNRDAYCKHLQKVHEGDWESWIKFFLQAVIESANDAIATTTEIDELENALCAKLDTKHKDRHHPAYTILWMLFKQPIISSKTIQDWTNRSKPFANKLISEFEELGILYEYTKKKKGRKYAFRPLIDFMNKWNKQGG